MVIERGERTLLKNIEEKESAYITTLQPQKKRAYIDVNEFIFLEKFNEGIVALYPC
jgi:hypothetical protein